jgi:hypothetical protein
LAATFQIFGVTPALMLWAWRDGNPAAPAAASPTETKIFFILQRSAFDRRRFFPFKKISNGRLPVKFISQASCPSKQISGNYSLPHCGRLP